jgi:predicted enzyme related to lactoylglutathione lyase
MPGVIIALLGLLAGAAAQAQSPSLPAIAQPATQEHHEGKVIFVQLVTPNLAQAQRFYGGLFGWTFQNLSVGGIAYSEAYLAGQPVAGMVERSVPTGVTKQSAWMSFIAAPDVDAAKNLAVQHGAKVLFGPKDIPGRGREVFLADPQGAPFAVLASSSGDPPDVLPEPGTWIWSSLIAQDPDTDAAFYQTLFKYEVFDLSTDPSSEHLLLATENYARASANALPANRPHAHAHWMNYVRVDNADEATAKVSALGGRVLIPPHLDRHGGKVAVVADPLGAPFGLLEWTENDSKEVSQ